LDRFITLRIKPKEYGRNSQAFGRACLFLLLSILKLSEEKPSSNGEIFFVWLSFKGYATSSLRLVVLRPRGWLALGGARHPLSAFVKR
jgi:hypothetical protein